MRDDLELKSFRASRMMRFNPSSLPDRLRNNKDFLRIGVLNFGPGWVAAHIDISAAARIERIINQTSSTRNWLGGWELRLCRRAARRRRGFGLRHGTPARSCGRGRGGRNDPLRRLRLLPRWALRGCCNGVSRSGDVRSCRRRRLRWVVAMPPEYLHRRGSDTIRTDRDAAGHTVRTDGDTAGDMVRSNRNIVSRSTSSEQNRSQEQSFRPRFHLTASIQTSFPKCNCCKQRYRFNPSTQQPLQQNRRCLDRSPTMSTSGGTRRAQ